MARGPAGRVPLGYGHNREVRRNDTAMQHQERGSLEPGDIVSDLSPVDAFHLIISTSRIRGVDADWYVTDADAVSPTPHRPPAAYVGGPHTRLPRGTASATPHTSVRTARSCQDRSAKQALRRDCLYLNVYTPDTDRSTTADPVMVWLHGGGLAGGAGRLYEPTGLVRKGVTVVTINYRLGALGFMAHPVLADRYGQSGDYGLMDQNATLRWVERNISNFGGDPDNVTILVNRPAKTRCWRRWRRRRLGPLRACRAAPMTSASPP